MKQEEAAKLITDAGMTLNLVAEEPLLIKNKKLAKPKRQAL